MSDHSALFKPLDIGTLTVPNRVLMAPLTRNRAQSDGTPKAMAIDYYRQRASAGLIFSEATQINAKGKGYIDTPGIHEESHVREWSRITEAVHAAGGRIFLQLWHVGRISHTSLQADGEAPWAPSAIRAEAQTFTADGFQDCSEPKAMTKEDIRKTVWDYGQAARNALEAGFDGIEVHAANGYLLDQFLQDKSNRRDDEYGGSIENRLRFLNEVVEEVSQVYPRGRIGVRLSPLGQFNDMGDSNPKALFSAVVDSLNQHKLAYLHVVEQFPGSEASDEDRQFIADLRAAYQGVYIANGGYDLFSAVEAINSGHADALTFGRPFIANPDLPERFRQSADLNQWDDDTFYGGGRKGYTDYPFLADATEKENNDE